MPFEQVLLMQYKSSFASPYMNVWAILRCILFSGMYGMYMYFKKKKVICSYVIILCQLVSVNGKSSLKDIWYT